MAELQHTPFPWYVHPASLEECDIVSVEAMSPDRKMVTREVCTVMIDGDTKRERAEDVANARLIAAAPEMYALVRELAEFLNADHVCLLSLRAKQMLLALHGDQPREGGG